MRFPYCTQFFLYPIIQLLLEMLKFKNTLQNPYLEHFNIYSKNLKPIESYQYGLVDFPMTMMIRQPWMKDNNIKTQFVFNLDSQIQQHIQMGQSQSNKDEIHKFLPLLQEYKCSGDGSYLIHNSNESKARVKAYQFNQNKNNVDNYFRNRVKVSNHPQIFDIYQYKIVVDAHGKQDESQKSINNICNVRSPRVKNSQTNILYSLVEALPLNLENQIMNRVGKKSFQEIQLWSVLSSCVLGAIHMLQMGFKQPVLSPKGIGLSKEGLIKVGQWQISVQMGSKFESYEDGEILLNKFDAKCMNKNPTDLEHLLLNYYWAPEGVKAMEDFVAIGQQQLKNGSTSRRSEYDVLKKFQVFSLGMTLISMCLRNVYYRTQTFSEKYIKKLVNQAIEIRKVQGKKLSQEMQQILKKMIKWDPTQRIGYWELRQLIIKHFNASSQDLQASDLSIQTFLNQSMEEQSQFSQSSIITHKSDQICHKLRPQISTSSAQNSIVNYFGHNLGSKQSFNDQNSTSFQGSGMVNQGQGDDFHPQQEQQQKMNKNKNPTLLTKKSKQKPLISIEQDQEEMIRKQAKQQEKQSGQSRRSYRCSQKQPIKIPCGESIKIKNNFYNNNIYESRQVVQNIGDIPKVCEIDEEDCPNKQVYGFHQIYEQQEENPDLFESLEIQQSSRGLSQLNQWMDSSQKLSEKSISRLITFNQSPAFCQKSARNRTPLIPIQINDNPRYQYAKDQHIFTDPLLLQYIRSPVNSQNQSFNNTGKISQHLKKQNQDKENNLPINISDPKYQKNEIMGSPKKNNDIRLVKEQVSKGFYEGQKKNGMRCGYGVFYYNEGGKYKGNWMHNKMHGKGTLEYADGRIAYQGQWNCDQLHGKGILYNQAPLFISGCANYEDLNTMDECWLYYDGNFYKDDKCGEGTLMLSNGEQFTGIFANDMAEGDGKFKTLNKKIIIGRWSENKLIKVYNIQH